VISVGLYFIVAASLKGPYGYLGLVFADSVKQAGHALIMVILLLRSVGRPHDGIGRTAVAAIGAAVAMGAAVWLVSRGLALVLPDGFHRGAAVGGGLGGSRSDRLSSRPPPDGRARSRHPDRRAACASPARQERGITHHQRVLAVGRIANSPGGAWIGLVHECTTLRRRPPRRPPAEPRLRQWCQSRQFAPMTPITSRAS